MPKKNVCPGMSMVRSFVTLIFMVFYLGSSGQTLSIDPCELNKALINKFLCLDSNKILTPGCGSLNSFGVQFYQVDYDKKARLLRLVGRICLPGVECTGMQGIEIIQGNLIFDKLTADSVLGYSTNVPGTKNNGFFDITCITSEKKYLLFYNPGFSAKVYDILQVVRNILP